MKTMETYHSKYNSFYQTKEWKELRAIKFAQANGLCEECLKKSKIAEGKEIHHIEPIETPRGWRLRYDINNLVCLCRECHDKQHSRASAWSEFKDFWEKL